MRLKIIYECYKYDDAVVVVEGSDENTIPCYIFFKFVNFNDIPNRCGKEMSFKEVLACKFITKNK